MVSVALCGWLVARCCWAVFRLVCCGGRHCGAASAASGWRAVVAILLLFAGLRVVWCAVQGLASRGGLGCAGRFWDVGGGVADVPARGPAWLGMGWFWWLLAACGGSAGVACCSRVGWLLCPWVWVPPSSGVGLIGGLGPRHSRLGALCAGWW